MIADLRRAVGLWARSPLLPFLQLVVGVLLMLSALYEPTDPPASGDGFVLSIQLPPLALSGLLLQVFLAGPSRLYYARLIAGDDLSGRDLLLGGRRGFWRFFRLGLLYVVAFLVFAVIASLVAVGLGGEPSDTSAAGSFVGAAVAGTIFALAWPLLALRETTAGRAWANGRALALATDSFAWTAGQATVLAALFHGLPQLVGDGPRAVLALVSAPASFAVAGAVTLFVLRHLDDVGPWGSLQERTSVGL